MHILPKDESTRGLDVCLTTVNDAAVSNKIKIVIFLYTIFKRPSCCFYKGLRISHRDITQMLQRETDVLFQFSVACDLNSPCSPGLTCEPAFPAQTLFKLPL